MLYLCLRFPLLGLEALGHKHDHPAPAVLTEQGRVLLCNTAAQHNGVSAGMSVGQAQALCPGLHSYPRHTQREQMHLARLALWAYRFSDEVSLCGRDALIIEVSRSKRLFGSIQRLHQRLLSAYQQRSLAIQQGLGPTPLCAELLSLKGISVPPLLGDDGTLKRAAMKRQLTQLPSQLLPVSSKSHSALHNMGLQSLGEVLALPRKALLSGFEPAFCDAIDRLTGRKEDVRPRFLPQEPFTEELQLPGGVQHVIQLRPAIDDLLQELEIYLRLRQAHCQVLSWCFYTLDGKHEPWQTPISLPRFDRSAILALVMLQLEGHKLGSPVESVSLRVEPVNAAQAPKAQLFGDASQDQRDARDKLFNTLRLRLGEDRICQLQQSADWLPEYQGVATPRPQYHGAAPVISAALRPTALLDTPQALPLHRGSPHWQGELDLLQGPERIDTHWWQHRQVRDYYIARHAQQGLCWVYKDCLSQQWYLHGFFA